MRAFTEDWCDMRESDYWLKTRNENTADRSSLPTIILDKALQIPSCKSEGNPLATEWDGTT